jgi:hypothetical protein
MDRKHSEKSEIEQLIRLSETARLRLDSEAAKFRERIDIPARIRSSLAAHPSSWLLGSLASGFAARLLFARRRSRPATKPRGLAGPLLGIALTAARPLAKLWLSGQLGRLLQKSPPAPPTGRPMPRPLPKSPAR